MEAIIKELDGIKNDILSLVDVEVKKIETSVSEKADKSVISEIKNLTEKLQDSEGRMDKLSATLNNKFQDAEVKNFEGALIQSFTKEQNQISQYKNTRKPIVFDFDKKVAAIMSSDLNLTGTLFVPPTQVPGIYRINSEPLHVRDVMNFGSTNSNSIRFVRQTSGEGTFDMVPEGGLKPLNDAGLAIIDAPVRKIAGYYRIPEEMLDDIPYLASFISSVGVLKLLIAEDAQILFGDGTGQNLNGINTTADEFDAGDLTVSTPNNYDVIIAAKNQLRVGIYLATAIFMHPNDYTKMRLEKDTQGRYLFDQLAAGLNTIDGIPVIQHRTIPEGSFLMGDFRNGAQVFQRSDVTVRYYDQDQDNAIRNLVTVVIEERLALATYRTQAFIKGVFADAIADLAT